MRYVNMVTWARRLGVAFASTAILVLAACGGGGGGGSSSDTGGGGSSGSVLTVSTLAGVPDVVTNAAGNKARFNSPFGIVKVNSTTLYIADYYSKLIRKLDLSTNTETTVAGLTYSTTAVDGTGTSANFVNPAAMVQDSGGTNIYIADQHAIRKLVISTGAVTTLAGGATSGSTDANGTSASFNSMEGLAIDATYLYIADTGNHTIRKMTLAAPYTVTTVAGTTGASGTADNAAGTSASFTSPSQLVLDGSNLYVSQPSNHTIRMVNVSTTAVTTIAGTAGTSGHADGTGTAATFYKPAGLAVDATYVYVMDYFNGLIRRIQKSNAAVTTIAGTYGTGDISDGNGTAAHLWYPRGALLSGTTLYFSDDGAIRTMNLTSTAVTTLAGVQALRDGTGNTVDFAAIGAITSDSTYAYVTDATGNSIRKINISTGTSSTLAGGYDFRSGTTDGTGRAALFNTPTGIASDGTNLYVADKGNHTIRKIVISTGVVTTFAGQAGVQGSTDNATGTSASLDTPYFLTTDGTYLYLVETTTLNRIRKINIATSAVTTLTPNPALTAVTGLVANGSSLYLAMAGHKILSMNTTTGVNTVLAGSGTAGSTNATGIAASFNTPYDVTTDGTYLYVADNGNATIRKVSIATGAVTTYAGQTGLTGWVDGASGASRFLNPFAITRSGGTLLLVDLNQQAIRKIQ